MQRRRRAWSSRSAAGTAGLQKRVPELHTAPRGGRRRLVHAEPYAVSFLPLLASSLLLPPYLDRLQHPHLYHLDPAFLEPRDLGIRPCIDDDIRHHIVRLEVVQRDYRPSAARRRGRRCAKRERRRRRKRGRRSVGVGSRTRRRGIRRRRVVDDIHL
jgi:hypothetical protein